MKHTHYIVHQELNLENANELFFSCVATPRSKNITKTVLFPQDTGFEQDSPPIFFDVDAVENNKHFVMYMLGQLKAVHEHSTTTTTQSIVQNYLGNNWINNAGSLISFLHLAYAANLIGPVNAKDLSISISPEIEPTFSKDHPNFETWFSDYKERTFKKINGQEPADD